MTGYPSEIGVAVCVAAFQRRRGLTADDVIGPETERALRGEALATTAGRKSPGQVREQIVQRRVRRALVADRAARKTTTKRGT